MRLVLLAVVCDQIICWWLLSNPVTVLRCGMHPNPIIRILPFLLVGRLAAISGCCLHISPAKNLRCAAINGGRSTYGASSLAWNRRNKTPGPLPPYQRLQSFSWSCPWSPKKCWPCQGRLQPCLQSWPSQVSFLTLLDAKLEFLVSLGLLITIFSIFFLADVFLMLPEVGDEEEVLEDAPLYPGEVVPDGIFLPYGSCCTRRVSPCSCWPRLLHGWQPINSDKFRQNEDGLQVHVHVNTGDGGRGSRTRGRRKGLVFVVGCCFWMKML